MNVALLSRWHVHADDYARAVHENDQLTIGLVWDEDAKRGEEWARELGVPFECNLEAVLSNPEIDAVVVSTPTNLHKEIILAAASHNKHIFTEKVLDFTVQDCEEIYEAVDAHDVMLMVSLPRLTEKEFLAAERALAEGWLGKLTMIRCRLAHNGAVLYDGKTEGWLPARFFNKQQTGGGALIDLGAHPIYLTNRLAGKAQAVSARLKRSNPNEVDESGAVLVDYQSGALGIIETSFLSHGSPFQLELYGTEGTLLCRNGSIQMTSMHHGNGEWINMESDLPDVSTPMEQWVAQISEGVMPTITREDVIQLTKINDGAALSDLEGRRVVFEL
ncbi:dehydrogenase [Virgibacillus phasianinus]|uniref:Dehydrogenase n=1 Tax=Virgibacillus phasianinus TaxID=2017483 RepID=A0A220U4B6_9BACI|nr:Gfo/Idh/MocA family oxidoreductase [Virgibacillus phasianinus]ASK62573.1 dehydrogenase [Virgibacillus phasianinus]